MGLVSQSYEYESPDGGRRSSKYLDWDWHSQSRRYGRQSAVDFFGDKEVTILEQKLQEQSVG